MKRRRIRPKIPEYGIEESEKGMLSWEFVETILPSLKHYWVSTTRPDGKPHTTPVWGAWVDDRFYFSCGPNTQKARNLKANPNIVVHSESAGDVVIVEGVISTEIDQQTLEKINEQYLLKYDMGHDPPFYQVTPSKVFAWKIEDFAGTPTKWIFLE